MGELRYENFAVETVHGRASRKRYAGTIRQELVDDTGLLHVHEIPGAIYDPETQFNLIGVPFLAAYFGNGGKAPDDDVDSDGTQITSSRTCSKLVWDNGRYECNFTHPDSSLPELMLFQGNGYFMDFCTRMLHSYNDAVSYAFLSAFTISPTINLDPALVSDDEDSDSGDKPTKPADLLLEVEWYSPHPFDHSEAQVSSPPAVPVPSTTSQAPSNRFQLGMSLSYLDGEGHAETVVYEGVMSDGLTHTIRRADGTRLQVHDAYLRLKLQADLSNLPKTPYDYCKEVGTEVSKDEAEALARPRILTPL